MNKTNTSLSRQAVGSTDSEATEKVVRGTDVETKRHWLGRLDALLGGCLLFSPVFLFQINKSFFSFLLTGAMLICFGFNVYYYKKSKDRIFILGMVLSFCSAIFCYVY